jgi:flagellin
MNSNITSSFAQRALDGNWRKSQQSTERLSSGLRINHSGDDAAGSAITEKIRASVKSLDRAAMNVRDAFAFMDVTDGAFHEVGNILTRLRELAIQAASDTIGDTERRMVEAEVRHLVTEVDRIAESTEYNGVYMLNGSVPHIDIQVDASAGSTSRVQLDSASNDVRTRRLGITDVSVAKKHLAQSALGALDGAIDRLGNARAGVGAVTNRLRSVLENATTYRNMMTAARSRIQDTDIAEEAAEATKFKLITQSNVAMLGQANQSMGQALRLMA